MLRGKTYGFHMVVSIGFLVMLTLPLVGIWLGLPQVISINENRKLAPVRKWIQILKSKKSDDFLYQLTDTHWNDLGAFYSYQAIAQLLKKDFPRTEPVSLEENSQRRSSNQLGNLARMARLSDEYSEAIPLLQPKNPKIWLEGRVSSDSVPSMYPQFRITPEVRNSGNKNLSKLLVIRDSYTTDMIPWLSSHFGTSVYLWDNWQYQLHKNIVEAEKPDVVMVIMLEEYLEKLKL